MASNLSYGMKRVLSGIMALLIVAGSTGLPANVRGGGLFARSVITAKAEELSGYVRLNEVQEGDIIGPDVRSLMGEDYTIVLKGGGYCDERGEVGVSDHSMGVDAELDMPLWRWINNGYEVSAFRDNDNHVHYYPYYNGAKVDSWCVVSVEDSTITLTGYAETQSNNPFASAVNYRQYNSSGVLQDNGTLEANTGIKVESNTVNWTDGNTYVVSENVTITKRINVTGTVNLILLDGATLTASKGVSVNGVDDYGLAQSNTLNIYAGSTSGSILGTGALVADARNSNGENAGLGGDQSTAGGILNIHGGVITAYGNVCGAGIGGGNGCSHNTITIYDGTINATGGNNGSWGSAGIGAGFGATGGTVYIYGGTVNATGTGGSAGIGGGCGTATNGSGGTVYIYGGTVNATGGNNSAMGIGAAQGGSNNGALTLGEGLVLQNKNDDTWTNVENTGTEDEPVYVRAKNMRTAKKLAVGQYIAVGDKVYTDDMIMSNSESCPHVFPENTSTVDSVIYEENFYKFTITPENNQSSSSSPDDPGNLVVYGAFIASETERTPAPNGFWIIGGEGTTQNPFILSLDPPPSVTYTHVEAVAPTCTTAGNIEYYLGSDGKYYSDDQGTLLEDQNVIIPATGHSYGTPTYSWTEENGVWKCTATRTCANNTSHVETETVDGIYAEVTPATVNTVGTGRWTATFTNEAFTAQTKDVEIAQLVPEKHDAVAPTCTEPGNIEYYTYGDKYYTKDGETYTEITQAQTVEPATGHAFNYVPNGAVLTASCTHDNCEFENGVSLTIVHPNSLTYDGSEKGVTLDGLVAFNTATGLNISLDSIIYEQLVGEEYQRIDSVPMNAGSYRASLTVGEQTISVDYSIAKAAPEYTAPTGRTAIYGQTLADVELPTGWAWVNNVDTPVGNAGEHTFSATFTPDDTNNFNTVTEDVTVTVGKATLTPTVSVTGWTYGETQNAPDVSGLGTEQIAAIGVYNITGELWKYNGEEFEKVKEVPLAAISLLTGTTLDAGTYKVKLVVAESTNYEEGEWWSDEFIVAKAGSSVTAPTAKTNLFYTGNSQALINAGSADGGEMQYSLDNSTWSTEIPTGTDADDYTVYYKVVGDGNHNDNNGGSVEVNIAKADIVSSGNIANDTVWLTGDYIDFGDGAYIQSSWSPNSGKWHLTGKHKLGYGGFYTDHYWFLIEGVCDFNLNNDGKSGQPVYGLTISGSGTENDPYTAVPLHMPYATVTVSTAKDLIYSGSAQLLVTEGASNGGTVKYSLGTADEAGGTWTEDISALTGTNANTYYVWYYVEGDANHKNTDPVCIPVTISQKSIENAVIILDKDAFEVNEVPAVPAVTYVIVGNTLLEATDYNVDYENNTSISANTPTVVITGTGNYGGTARKSFVIGTNLSDAVVTVNGTSKYNGTAKTPGVTVTYKGTVVNAANYTVSYSDNINAGTATVTITGNTDKGYTGSASATFNIAKAGITSVSATDTYAYTGEAIIPTLVVKDENNKIVDTANYNVEFVNNVKAGTATIVVTAKDGTNYTGTKTGTFEIGHRYTEVPATSAGCSTTGVKAHWTDENGAAYLKNTNEEYVAATATDLATPATGNHNYNTEAENIQWFWTTDNSGAFAVFTCEDCGTKTNVNAVVASRAVAGGTQYTATVVLGDDEYTTSKIVKNKYIVAFSEISGYELANTTGGVSFTYRNSYDGNEDAVYGFLCYRDGVMNDDMTVDMAGVVNVKKPSAIGTLGVSDKGTGIYLRPYIKIGDVYVYGDQVYVKHSDLMNQKAFDEATSKITGYVLANNTGGISFNYSNTYKGTEDTKYGFLCYRDGVINEDMTVDMAGVANVTKPSADGTLGVSDKGNGIYLRSYIKIGDRYKYGEQIYVKHSDLMNQKAFDEATSKITGYVLANNTGGISFNYSNTYKGTEDAVYGFLCYRDGAMSENMTVGMNGVINLTKPSADGTLGVSDKGNGIYLRSYIKIGDRYKYGEQIYVKHSDLMNQKAFDEATSKITGYVLANNTSGISFNYSNTYKGTEDAVYGFLCYRDGAMSENMTVDMNGVINLTKPSADGTLGVSDKGTGIYLRSYIKIGDQYKYGDQVYVNHSDLLRQKTLEEAKSVITGYEIVNNKGGMSFTYKNTYAGSESAVYGFLCYRDGELNQNMTVGMDGVTNVTKPTATGTLGVSDKGKGIYLRSYIKIGDVYVYGDQVFVKFSNLNS